VTPRHTVVHDWDGTLVTNRWPEMGDWQPGAIRAVKRLHAAGLHQVVFSARLSPYDPFTSMRRDPAHVEAEAQKMRAKLDAAGLTYVEIWRKEGKPGASVYTDDKAERYHGRPGSWDRLADKILMRLGKEPAEFPAFDQSLTEEAAA
jgi:hypothetical protein